MNKMFQKDPKGIFVQGDRSAVARNTIIMQNVKKFNIFIIFRISLSFLRYMLYNIHRTNVHLRIVQINLRSRKGLKNNKNSRK